MRPYFRRTKKQPLYIGVVKFVFLEQVSEFSTFELSYPQYLGGYPQDYGTELQCFCNFSPIYDLV